MIKVVKEPVYFPHYVFVPRTTMHIKDHHVIMLIPMHFYIPLCLKHVLIGVIHKTTYITHAKILSVFK